jgi:hypothetical protein
MVNDFLISLQNSISYGIKEFITDSLQVTEFLKSHKPTASLQTNDQHEKSKQAFLKTNIYFYLLQRTVLPHCHVCKIVRGTVKQQIRTVQVLFKLV